MSHPFAFIVISSVALLLLGGASWADEELEYASNLGGEDDVGVDTGASPQQPGPRKRNLAALARGGRLPGFHYHGKLGPGSQGGGSLLPGRLALASQQQAHRQDQGWMGDQAFPGDVPDRIGVVEALGRLSETAIFPYIGPHRFSFLRSMRMRRAASGNSPQQPIQPAEHGRDKRNVAALARNGWLPRGASSRGTRADVLRRHMSSSGSSSSQELNTDEQFAEEEADLDCIQEGRQDLGYDQFVLMPEGAKRNLGHLARMGRLPPFNYRRLWNGQAESPATSPWPQARRKRQARRCRPNEEAKRNVAAMARKGMLPRS